MPDAPWACESCGQPTDEHPTERCRRRVWLRVTSPAGNITPGGNPTCPKCGLWYGPGLPHKCVPPPVEGGADV